MTRRLILAAVAMAFGLTGCGLYMPGRPPPPPLYMPGNPGSGPPTYCYIDIGPTNPHPDCP